jgi:hypothetical protein
MGRRTRGEYLTTADYALGWGGNRDFVSTAIGGSEEEAMQQAAGLVDQMRRDRANSAIRRVMVRHWRVGSSLAAAPVVFEASYFDPEQGLTADEAYASRVHDWHARTDRDNQVADLGPLDYRPWSDEWGPEPALCPMCAAILAPQNYYKYNGQILVRLDGTRQLLGN